MEIKLIKIDNESYFVYQSSRKVYKERVADIMYFARGGRRVTMHSRESGEIELYCSLVEIYRVQKDFIILISQCLLIYLI